MINALDIKINALAARSSWHIPPRAGDGLHWYEVAPMDRPDRDAILRTLARCKGLTAETWEPYSPTAWACVIRVYDASELAEWRRVDAQKSDLANYFCQIIHDASLTNSTRCRHTPSSTHDPQGRRHPPPLVQAQRPAQRGGAHGSTRSTGNTNTTGGYTL